MLVDAKKNANFCPRLIDYLVVVGSRNPGGGAQTGPGSGEDGPGTGSQLGVVQNPELLRRYPSEDHKDFYLPIDVTYFCQPEGCITVGPRRITFRETTSFVFTLTEKDDAKIRFGICLNFFRPCQIRPQGGSGQKPRRRQKSHTLTSLCLISHHPFFTTFRETLVLLRRLINACNERTSTKKAGGSKLKLVLLLLFLCKCPNFANCFPGKLALVPCFSPVNNRFMNH